MSTKPVTMHVRRICATGAGVVLLLLVGWLPVATASPPDPQQDTVLLTSMPAATD